jgi:hypothetical protein
VGKQARQEHRGVQKGMGMLVDWAAGGAGATGGCWPLKLLVVLQTLLVCRACSTTDNLITTSSLLANAAYSARFFACTGLQYGGQTAVLCMSFAQPRYCWCCQQSLHCTGGAVMHCSASNECVVLQVGIALYCSGSWCCQCCTTRYCQCCQQ